MSFLLARRVKVEIQKWWWWRIPSKGQHFFEKVHSLIVSHVVLIYLIFFSRIFLKVGRFSFIASQILFFCSLWQKNASYDQKVDFHIILTSLSFCSWLNLDVKSSGYFFIEMSKKEKIVILSSSCCVMMSYCNFFELLNQRQKISGVRCRREHLQC